MGNIKKDMLEIYKPISGLDWLNYKLIKKDVTFHHIKKKCEGGLFIIDNGALLMSVAHQYLHLIECRDINTYIAINKMFKYINQQKHEPTTEQREMLEYLLKEFEKIHKWDKSSKGKILIQKKYLNRSVF